MALFFRKRHTPPLRMKSNGGTVLKGKYFTHSTTSSYSVAIAFLGSKSLEVVETKNDDQGRILIADKKICDKQLVLVNLQNANTEKEQSVTLIKVSEMLNSILNIVNKNVILGGDFNLFFNTSLETLGGNSILKKKALTKLIETK